MSADVAIMAEHREQIIEEGWRALESTLHPAATPEHRAGLRKAFYAGALHLWVELVNLLGDEDLSEHRKDFKLVDIQHELERFVEGMAGAAADRPVGGKLDG